MFVKDPSRDTRVNISFICNVKTLTKTHDHNREAVLFTFKLFRPSTGNLITVPSSVVKEFHCNTNAIKAMLQPDSNVVRKTDPNAYVLRTWPSNVIDEGIPGNIKRNKNYRN